VGLPAARVRARELRDAAIAALGPLAERGAALAQLANFVIDRAS
jgi:geranylgeranyl pyrophosphate synthase